MFKGQSLEIQLTKLRNKTFFDFPRERAYSAQPAQYVLHSIELFNIIKNTEQFGLLGSVSVNEANLNASCLSWFVLDIYRSTEANSLNESNFNIGPLEPKTIVSALFQHLPVQPSADFLRKSYLLIDTYDVPSNKIFFINTIDIRYPLRVYRTKQFSVMYRLPSMSHLIVLLNNLVNLLLYYVLEASVFLLSDRSTLLFKEYILQMYTGLNLPDYATLSSYPYVIFDAYNNLISMSLCNLDMDQSSIISSINNIAGEFKINLLASFSKNKYTKMYLPEQVEYYEGFFDILYKSCSKVIQYLNLPKAHDPKRGTPLDIKYYYFYNADGTERDQDPKACNKTKVSFEWMRKEVIKFYGQYNFISGQIDNVHPDIIIGLFNISLHLKLLGLECLTQPGRKFHRFITLLFNKKLRLKPILIKFIIKNGADMYFHHSKVKGLVEFNQFEVLFGFRNAGLIMEEISEDYLNWFNQGLDENGPLQSQFIDQHSEGFFKNFKTNKGVTMGQLIRNNLQKYSSFRDLAGNPFQFLSSTGAVDRDAFIAQTDDGKNRTVSKNIYFSLFRDPESYLVQPKTSKYNKVLVKYEEYVKQRIVINSTLNTFSSLAQLNEFVKKSTQDSGNIYFSSSRRQKALLNKRLQCYLQYNRYVGKKYVILPLDYSSYDHTITLEFIKSSLRNLAKYTPYQDDVDALINEFLHQLSLEEIKFDLMFKDPKYKNQSIQKYKYGMLSGWKITSSVESLGNAIISYGVIAELGYKLVDLLTMGDDLVIILDMPDLNDDQLQQVLIKICDKYESLGFKMNAPKNSISYTFCEFLRVVYYPNMTINYPARILPSISVLKPGREEGTFGAREYLSVAKKICKRYGALSHYLEFVRYTSHGYKLSDIRRNAYNYTLKPWMYEFRRRERIDYKLKVNTKEAPIYKRYINILGVENSNVIIDYIDKNIATHVTQLTELRKKKNAPERAYIPKSEMHIMTKLVNMFKSHPWSGDTHRFTVRIPEYHMAKLIEQITSELQLDTAKKFLRRVVGNLRDQGIVNSYEADDSLNAIARITTKADIIRVLEPSKILVDDEYAQNILVSFIKDQFIKWADRTIQLLRPAYAKVLKQIISKYDTFYSKKLLGILISDLGEIKLPNFPIISGLRVD